MLRFLTPEKIALLKLIAIYCDRLVAPEESLHVLSFLASHVIPAPSKHWEDPSAKTGPFVLTLEILRINLVGRASSQDSHDLWTTFSHALQDICDLDGLFDFFAELEQVFRGRETTIEYETGIDTPILLLKTSPLGIFVRKCRLEFEQLIFQDAVALWTGFEKLITPLGDGAKAHDRKEEIDDLVTLSNGKIASILSSATSPTEAAQHHSLGSSHDVQVLLEFQLEKMQATGIRLSHEMESYLKSARVSALDNNGMFDYIIFLNAWFSGDYAESFQSLHRYYDYALHSKDRSHYQYALLNMAIMQADFGCMGEAFTAMNEAIASARENKDVACLNYCLSWLHHARRSHHLQSFTGSKSDHAIRPYGEGLAYLKQKSEEEKMWPILTSALLGEAMIAIEQGGGQALSFERIVEAADLIVKHDLASSRASQLLAEAALFSRLGMSSLSTSLSHLVHTCYGVSSSVDEIVNARCLDARSSMYQGKSATATAILDNLNTSYGTTLRVQNAIQRCKSLMKFYSTLNMVDTVRVTAAFKSLCSHAYADRDASFEAELLYLTYLIRSGEARLAYDFLDSMMTNMQNPTADITQRLRLDCAKAMLFQKVGKQSKGFTIALRAMITSIDLKLVPLLCEAVHTVSLVLIEVAEYEKAKEILDATLGFALDSPDLELEASLKLALADASMGLASKRQSMERRRLGFEAAEWAASAGLVYQLLGKGQDHRDCKLKEALALKFLATDS